MARIRKNAAVSEVAEVAGEPATSGPEKKITFADLITAIKNDDVKVVARAVEQKIGEVLAKYDLQNYLPLFLFDDADSINHFHADRLYSAASANKEDRRDILLVVQSRGGSIEPAYLASKALKRLSKQKFVAVVPRRAKSAATLICLGADEIHMGVMSELGPIDPQFGGLPALGLGNALEVIADLTCKFPGSATLFSDYVAKQAPLKMLGYYQRVSESAVQYGERLLAKKFAGDDKRPHEISDKLANHYKDHSFVIDVDEALELLGDDMIKLGTPEYLAGDEIYRYLDLIEFIVGMERDKRKDTWLVGAIDGFGWRDRSE